MKVLIVLATFAAVATAGRVGYGAGGLGAGGFGAGGLGASGYGLGNVGGGYGAAGYGGQLVNTGSSSQFRHEDNYGNYNFGYDESHGDGATSRREEQQGGVTRGSYSLSDADGRQRTVDYVADDYGFRATVHTNEPGVEPRDPANVLINKNGHGAVHSVAAAPIAAAPIAAPLQIAAAPLAAPVASYGAGPAAIARGHGLAGPAAFGPVAAAPLALAAGPAAYGPAQGGVYEAQAPRAFSYQFGATHVAPVAAPAYAAAAPAFAAQAPLALAAGPAYSQQRGGY